MAKKKRLDQMVGRGQGRLRLLNEPRPGATDVGPRAFAGELRGAVKRKPEPYGAYVAKSGPRKGERFNVVHRDGKRFHKYESGQLVADAERGSSTTKPTPEPRTIKPIATTDVRSVRRRHGRLEGMLGSRKQPYPAGQRPPNAPLAVRLKAMSPEERRVALGGKPKRKIRW
jgi:hypothetical protein